MRRWLLVLQALVAAYILPALFLADGPPVGSSFVSTYRKSAIWVVGLLAVVWNFAYWFKGFYPRIYRLNPRFQAETGARVIIEGRRGIKWDRPVGWQAAVGLQVRFLGLMMAGFAVWGAVLVAVIVLMTFLQEGPAGVLKFLHR